MSGSSGLELASLSVVVVAVSLIMWASRTDAPEKSARYAFPVLGILFFAISLAAVSEDPFGFWKEHVRNRWGVQIWWDLILMATVALFALVPRAKNVGMRVVPWALLVFATGSLGALCFYLRIIQRESKQRIRA